MQNGLLLVTERHIPQLQYRGRRRQYCGIFEAKYKGVIYYLLDNQYYFKRDGIYGYYDDAERFAFFSRAVLEMIPYIDFKPDIIHCNDWQTALTPLYYSSMYASSPGYENIKTVFTIHNIQYQGTYGKELINEVLGIPQSATSLIEYDGDVNFMKGAIETANRVITLEFEDFFFVTCYTPNSQNELKRLDYRMKWEDDLREYLLRLNKKKPVILCGDLNVAHNEIDLKNPKTNRKNAGFSDEEREKMTTLLNSGFTDSFRYLYPDKEGIYSWWSYRFNARKNNAGWRIDYFITSNSIKDKIIDSKIHTDIMGSDHCPVELDIDL